MKKAEKYDLLDWAVGTQARDRANPLRCGCSHGYPWSQDGIAELVAMLREELYFS